MNDIFSHILIVSDFDGTFAGKQTRILPKNLDAIKKFKAHGGHFTFATGRLPSMMAKVFPDFPRVVNAPLVMCNGAILYDPSESEIIAETVFDGNTARSDVRAVLNDFPSVRFAVYTDDGVLLENYAPEEVPGNRWRKINLYTQNEEEALRLRDHIRGTYPTRYHCFRSAPSFVEVIDHTVTKGNRIPFLRSYFEERGVKKTLVAGIGDFENDVDLLACVDLPFCPSNAVDEVKAISRHVLCNHDEGAIADMMAIIEKQYL